MKNDLINDGDQRREQNEILNSCRYASGFYIRKSWQCKLKLYD